MSVKMEWETGKGDARVDAFLAFVVCASFGIRIRASQIELDFGIVSSWVLGKPKYTGKNPGARK